MTMEFYDWLAILLNKEYTINQASKWLDNIMIIIHWMVWLQTHCFSLTSSTDYFKHRDITESISSLSVSTVSTFSIPMKVILLLSLSITAHIYVWLKFLHWWLSVHRKSYWLCKFKSNHSCFLQSAPFRCWLTSTPMEFSWQSKQVKAIRRGGERE